MQRNAVEHRLHVARIVGPCGARGRRRVNPAGRDRVDADAVLRPFDRQHPRHLDERRLGDAVGRALGAPTSPWVEAMLTTLPAGCRDQMSADLLGEEEGALTLPA